MKPQLIDLKTLGENAPSFGPQWGAATDDLNLTLLTWQAGHEIAPHVNSEVDVVWIVVAGEVDAVVDGETFRLMESQALLIPKGSRRSMRAVSRASYLSVHRRRAGLTISAKTGTAEADVGKTDD